jgi:hypothetical protein
VRHLAKEFRLDGRNLEALGDINLTIVDESFTRRPDRGGIGESILPHCVPGLDSRTELHAGIVCFASNDFLGDRITRGLRTTPCPWFVEHAHA